MKSEGNNIIETLEQELSSINLSINKMIAKRDALVSSIESLKKVYNIEYHRFSVDISNLVAKESEPYFPPSILNVTLKQSYLECENWAEKVYYILATNGPSFATDVAELVEGYEPNLDKERVYKNVMNHLSKLKNAGKINGISINGKTRYDIGEYKILTLL